MSASGASAGLSGGFPLARRQKPKPMSSWSNDEIAWRYSELRYRMIECAFSQDHPATIANQARWKREFKRVEAEADRRGLLEPREKEGRR